MKRGETLADVGALMNNKIIDFSIEDGRFSGVAAETFDKEGGGYELLIRDNAFPNRSGVGEIVFSRTAYSRAGMLDMLDEAARVCAARKHG